MARIELKEIRKSFGATDVLKGIDLSIMDGEFLTLVGPSGCGKSTLLRIIAGLELQDSGDVAIGDRSVNGVRSSARDLAMVFQSYALYPHLNVRQNMLTPLTLRDLSFPERFPLLGALMPGRKQKIQALNAIVSETAETLKIDHLMERKPGQLSGGQRQRVALGRAMVRKPAAFLMDEPLSNLDAALRVQMRAELAELHRSLATTFVYVTHDQAEALTMSDRMAVMMEGHILQLGAPNDVYSNPLDKRVAEFVGSPKINIFPGEADAEGRITALGAPLKRRSSKTSCDVAVGIRPEHLKLKSERVGNEGWPFRITHKENLGSDLFLHGHMNGSDHRIVARALPEEAAGLAIGAETFLEALPGQAMVFGLDNQRIPLEVH